MKAQQTRKAEVPLTGLSTLWFQVSGTLCNLECSHCFISCGPGVKRHAMMTREDVARHLDEARSTGIRDIYLTGGEPLLNPEITEITGDALKDANVTILTNATLITGEIARKFREVAEASPHGLTFRVSMESPAEEENDRVRGKGAFRRAEEGVRNLIAAGFEPIITATALEGGAGPCTEAFEDWLRGLGSENPRVKILPMLRIGRGGENYRPYGEDERLDEKALSSMDLGGLQCASARMITSEGVFACPILIDDPLARMGGTLGESLRPAGLTSPACYTCLMEGLSCSNTPGGCCGTETRREEVRSFYGAAAVEPQPELCCPTGYSGVETSHIPREVLDVAYGCASPVTISGLKEGETMLDLGAGAGIDCFIAAKITGPGGRVIGIDMTDEMLEKALRNKALVAENLGYDNVEFRKGFLEEIPAEDGSIDLVTSNCVINLTAEKAPVFSEIYRVLKDGGRFVISDIVSEMAVPPGMRADSKLWGECISGALTTEEFIRLSKEAGFYGITLLSESFYREAGGISFYSVTFEGRKLVKSGKCLYVGHEATYIGPFESVVDDEGHEFRRGVSMEVCTDTARRLSMPPYRGLFIISEPGERPERPRGCSPSEEDGESGSGKSGCC